MWLLKISLLQSGRKVEEGLTGEQGALAGVCCRGLGEFGLGQSRWRSEVNNTREFKVNVFSDGRVDCSKGSNLFPPPCIHALWHHSPNRNQG